MLFVQVDAFTDMPFAGNPAAVCVLDGPAPDYWMQQVAREMNLSETAFLHRHNEASTYAGLLPPWKSISAAMRRWPAPTCCGRQASSRMFAPRAGIPEDPVTGSSHCALGPFLAARLHKHQLVAFQASARGSLLRVRVSDERVYLQGQAVTVLRGELVGHGA